MRQARWWGIGDVLNLAVGPLQVQLHTRAPFKDKILAGSFFRVIKPEIGMKQTQKLRKLVTFSDSDHVELQEPSAVSARAPRLAPRNLCNI